MQRVSRVAEEAVREYLLALENHELVIDEQLVNDLLQRFDECEDPVERVLLAKQLRRAQDRDLLVKEREPDFVEFAAAWAESNDVVADDLHLAVGVPLEVLDRAGLKISDEYRRHLEESEGEPLDAVTTPAPPALEDEDPTVDRREGDGPSAADRVQRAMGTEPFTINDLVERTGVSRSTVRAVVERMADRLEELPAEGGGGPGRAARRFRVKRT